MTGSNSLKMLISKKIQADLGYFEVKVTTCLQEKENLLQNLQKSLEVKDAIIEGLNEKLEEVRTHMQAYVSDCTKKDEVIKDFEERVMEYSLTNSKKEQEINILIQMIREEKAMVQFLSQSKMEDTRDIAEIRTNLEDMVMSYNQEQRNNSVKNIEAMLKDIDEVDNDDALTEEIDLNESIEMQRLLMEKEDKVEYKQMLNQDLDTIPGLIVNKRSKSDDIGVEIAQTADTISNRIDSLLGKLNEKEHEKMKFISNNDYKISLKAKAKSFFDYKLEQENPAEKKLKVDINKLNLKPGINYSTYTYKSVDPMNYSSSLIEPNKVQTIIYEEMQDSEKLSCHKCNLTYNTKSGLVLHMQSKHEGIRYTCNTCNHTVTQKANLKKHMRMQHNNE